MLLMGTGKWKLLERGRDCIKGSVFQHGQWFSVYSAFFKCILSRQDMWKTWNMQEKKNRLVPVKENFTLCIFIFHALHRRLKKSALLVQMSYNRKHEFYFVYCFPVPDWVPKAIFWGIIAFFCCNESPLHGSFHNSRTGHVLGKIRALSFFVFFFLNLVHRVFNVFSYPSCDWKSRTFKSIAPNFQRMETPTNTLSDYLCRTSELMNLLLFVDNCIFSLCGPEAFGLET